MKSITWFVNKLMSGGNSWLRDYENQTIVAFVNSMKDEKVKDILCQQLKRYDLVQRSPTGHILQFFDLSDIKRNSWGSDIRVSTINKEVLYRVTLSLKNRKVVVGVAHLTSGVFTCVQFSKIPKHYSDKYVRITSLSVRNADNRFTVDCKEISDEEAEQWEKESFQSKSVDGTD